MSAVFLFGTLCHAPLRAVVLGHAQDTVAAQLRGYEVCAVNGGQYPMIRPADGAVCDGQVLLDVNAKELARLDYYEGAFGYCRMPVEVTTDQGTDLCADVYFLEGDEPSPSGDWDCKHWAAAWGEVTILAAAEIMQDMDRRSAPDAGQRYASFTARAQARLNARSTAPTTLRRNAASGDVEIAQRTLAYSQFFSVEEYDLSHRRFDGSMGPMLNRSAFISADAVTVLPYDPVRDRVMLVEQFRAGPFARGDAQPWMLEPIAGRIDGGETPENAARRESVEEAGLELKELHSVGSYYPTPGAKSEYLFGFIATADLPDEASGLGGVAAEGEDIRSHVLSFEHALNLIQTGEINVAPLIVLLLHLERIRSGLRAKC